MKSSNPFQIYFRFLLTIGISFVFNFGISQVEIGTYKWTESTFMNRCDYLGNPYKGTKQIRELSQQGQYFKIVELSADSAVIMILNYKKKESNFYTYNFLSDAKKLESNKYDGYFGEDQAYFKVGIDDIKEISQAQTKISSSMTLGAISFPFKFRPQKKLRDFSGAFNIGGAVGITFKHYSWRKTRWTALGSYSLSNIYLDSISTTSNQQELVQANNFNGWTVALGVMLEFEKVQIAVFCGSDRINQINQSRYGWKYQGKPWFSFGFGFALFSPFDEKTKEYSSNKQPISAR